MRKREWARCSDAEKMIARLWPLGDLNYINSRPFFFFVLTAGERLWTGEDSEVLRPTVELAWRRAELEASVEEITRHVEGLRDIFRQAQIANNWQLARLINVFALLFKQPGSAARTLVFPHPMSDPGNPPAPLLSPAELKNCCHWIREFFGEQGGSPPFDSAWRTSDVCRIAAGIYEDRAFRMPILADAFQDAGCDNDDILNHCRQPGEHVRGCWVVDLVLEKA